MTTEQAQAFGAPLTRSDRVFGSLAFFATSYGVALLLVAGDSLLFAGRATAGAEPYAARRFSMGAIDFAVFAAMLWVFHWLTLMAISRNTAALSLRQRVMGSAIAGVATDVSIWLVALIAGPVWSGVNQVVWVAAVVAIMTVPTIAVFWAIRRVRP